MSAPLKSEANQKRIRIETSNSVIIFGKSSWTLEQITQDLPEVSFCTLKQIHSNIVVKASSEAVEADGHWTDQTHVAPLIQTADCLPVFLVHPKVIFGIHAGWRGVRDQIVMDAIKTLKSQFKDESHFQVFMGPHIQTESFEVHNADATALLESIPEEFQSNREQALFAHSDPEKSRVNLRQIVSWQIESMETMISKIWHTEIDTFQDPEFHSFRRDKTQGRQWSFAYRKV